MTKNIVKIKTISDFKKAVAQPDMAIVFDRHDYASESICRSQQTLEYYQEPATIVCANSVGIQYTRGDETRKTYMDYPKKAEFEADGTDSVSIYEKDVPRETARKMSFRIVNKNDSFPPSALAENHPFIGDEAIKKEKEDLIKKQEMQKKKTDNHQKMMKAIGDEPLPLQDPRIALTDKSVREAIREAIKQGVYYTDDKEKFIHEWMNNPKNNANKDIAVLIQVPDLIITGSDHEENRLLETRFAKDLKKQPRGTWGRIFYNTPDFQSQTNTIMSTGRTEKCNKHSPIWSTRSNNKYTGSETLAMLQKWEYYLENQTVDSEIEKEETKENIEKYNIKPGLTLLNINIGNKLFSKATISEKPSDKHVPPNHVFLIGKVKGSRFTYTGHTSVKKIAQHIQAEQKDKTAPSPSALPELA